jgi:hypothetical protein
MLIPFTDVQAPAAPLSGKDAALILWAAQWRQVYPALPPSRVSLIRARAHVNRERVEAYRRRMGMEPAIDWTFQEDA